MNLGGPEIFVIAFVLVLLFGSKKLSEVARGAGKTTKELKKAKKEFFTSLSEADSEVKKTFTVTKK